MDEKNRFYCYSFRLYHFMMAFNEKCQESKIHDKTHRRYWIFEKSERLDRIIAAYTEMKHQFN